MRTAATVLALLVGFCSAACAPTDDSEREPQPEGMAVFQEHNCAFCHTVIAGEPVQESDSGSGDDAAEAKFSDLSGAGSDFTADVLRLFLVEGEEIDGRAHVTLFDGPEEEWAVLTDWLLGFAASRDTSGTERGDEGPHDDGSTDTLRIAQPQEPAPEAPLDSESE